MSEVDTALRGTTLPRPATPRAVPGFGAALRPALGVAAALALWAALTGPWSPPLTRSFAPDRALAAVTRLLASGTLEPHILASLTRIAVGLALATAVGVPLGILLARSRLAEDTSGVVFQFLRMISPLTWMPIAIMAFGIGDRPVVFLIVAAAVWPILLSTAHGVTGVDRRWIAAARTLGADSRELVRRVLVPAALPDVLNGVRLALGVAWIVLVPAEMLGVRSGVGYFVLDTRDRFAYDELGALVLVIGVLGYALDSSIRLARARLAWDRA